jgi:hypothetical protein
MPVSNTIRNLSDRDIEPTDDTVLGTASTTYIPREERPRLVWINHYQKERAAPLQARWQALILPSVCRFLGLPDGWDSYQGQALKLETGMFALKILNDVMGAQTPVPHVVPISGGIQFEWHENDLDLELSVMGPYDCELWYQDHRTGASDSIPLAADLTPLARQIARLTHSG